MFEEGDVTLLWSGDLRRLKRGSVRLQPSHGTHLQQHCNEDYKTYCSEYELETNALDDCMDRNGSTLTKACVQALVAAFWHDSAAWTSQFSTPAKKPTLVSVRRETMRGKRVWPGLPNLGLTMPLCYCGLSISEAPLILPPADLSCTRLLGAKRKGCSSPEVVRGLVVAEDA